MILEGTLREFPLRELLELMVFSSVTGALELQTSHGPGYIYTHMGQLYHATLADLSGQEAVWAFFEERDARFRFIAGETAEEHTLFSDAKTLSDEGEQRAQAWAAMRPRIGDLYLVPTLNPLPTTGNVQISEDDWPVMAAIDGQRNIREVASHALLDPLDACRVLLRLMDQGLVQLDATAHASAGTLLEQPAEPAEAAPRVKKTAVGKGRLLKGVGPRNLGHIDAQPADSQPATSRQGGLLTRLLASIPEEMIQEQEAEAEQSLAEQSLAEQSLAEQSLAEQSLAEQPVPEQPVPEQPVPEQPVPEPTHPYHEEEEILRILRGA